RLSARENAVRYFEEAKKMRSKTEGVRNAMVETRKRVEEEERKAREKAEEKEKKKSQVRVKEAVKREWFERFRWFQTSGGFLVIAGKDAKQNEAIVARHMDAKDLFFHADIHGAPATVVKAGGKEPGETDLTEAAQFAASYSNAWKMGYGSVDVYCVGAGQVSKHSHGEFVAKGGFVITGQRKWFRNTPLGLAIGERGGKPLALPAVHGTLPSKRVLLAQGALDRVAAAEKIKSRLGISVEETLSLLPAGGFEVT
ncbi:MAG: NFACT RNA binding domain-containing protein, partial [Candidatus Micrarchaeota archaeon]|nr:NFACT RNA binding domain-containing protein [Candidatus Micrarchaeota archaeon]